MRILLVQPPTKKAFLPLGLAYVAASLRRARHEVRVVDLGLQPDPVGKFLNEIGGFRPQGIGISLMFTAEYPAARSILARASAALEDIPVVAGGTHAVVDAKEVLRESRVDVVVRAEGEIVSPQLFHVLETGEHLASVPGIAYLGNGDAFVTTEPPEGHVDLDTVDRPAYDLFEIDRYYDNVRGHRALPMMTSRGCPFKCAFCYRGPAAGKSVRYMSVVRVIDELRHMSREYDVRGFMFTDDTFTLNRDRVAGLCEAIQAAHLRVSWLCMTRVDLVDEEILRSMKSAGCVGITFGLESGSQRVLDQMDKGFTLDQAKRALAACRKVGIGTNAYFMLGTPWETPDSLAQTIAFSKKLKASSSLFLAATPYPGTRMREEWVRRGLPLPSVSSRYRHWGEDRASWGISTKADDGDALDQDIRNVCLAARREVVRSQIRDVLSYPRLARDFICMYGVTDFAKKALKRLLRSC